MRRREFINLLGGAAVAWPLAARAQQPTRMRRIGVLLSYGANDPESRVRVAAFQQGLEKLGWIDKRNIQIDYRWAAGDANRMRTYAAELVGLKPDLLMTQSGQVLEAVHQATREIPIVFVQLADPVELGFVQSLAHPGGNITGFNSFESAIGGKWLEILKEVAPRVTQVAVMFDPDNSSSAAYLRAITTAAPSFSVHLTELAVRDAAAIEPAIDDFARDATRGLIVLTGALIGVNRDLITRLTNRYRLAAIYPFRFFVASGGLVSYGVDQVDQWRHAASYVDRILKGEKPANLPVQQPTKYELVVNLKTAKAIGLAIPETFLVRADEVIE